MITAVVVEGRSQAEVARAHGVSQPWTSRLVARYRRDGEAAFQPPIKDVERDDVRRVLEGGAAGHADSRYELRFVQLHAAWPWKLA